MFLRHASPMFHVDMRRRSVHPTATAAIASEAFSGGYDSAGGTIQCFFSMSISGAFASARERVF